MGDVIKLPERVDKPAPNEPKPRLQPNHELLRNVRNGLLELSSDLVGLKRTLVQLHQRILEETPK